MASNKTTKAKKKKKATLIPYPTEESFEPMYSSSYGYELDECNNDDGYYYQDDDEAKSMMLQEEEQHRQKQPMIIKSIQEKKYKKDKNTKKKILEKSSSDNKNETNNNKKPSRFLQQQHQKEKGFPSFQIPIGTLTNQSSKYVGYNKETIHHQAIKSSSKPKEREEKEDHSSNATSTKNIASSSTKDDVHDESYKMDNISRINNMSKEEINESINEIENILSSTSIQFLKHRHKKKQQKQSTNATTTIKTNKNTIENTITSKFVKEEKVVNDNTLSNNNEEESIINMNNTPFDEDRGIIEGDGNEITNYTTLLRSTSFLQRSLAIKYIYETCKQQRVDNDNKDDCYYPIMLPMSLRYILYETISSKNKNPTTIKIMQYHALYTLYHLVITSSNLDYTLLGCNSTLWKSIFAYPTIDILPYIPHNKKTQSPSISTTSTTSTAKAKVLEECQLFYKNPLYALTSTHNMNILPCFVDILLSQSCHDDDNVTSSTIIHDDTNYTSSTKSIILSLLLMFVLYDTASSTNNNKISLSILSNKKLLSYLLQHCANNNTNNTIILQLLYTSCYNSKQCATILLKSYNGLLFQNIITSFHNNTDNNSAYCVYYVAIWRLLLRYDLARSYYSTILSFMLPFISSWNTTSKTNNQFYCNIQVQSFATLSTICNTYNKQLLLFENTSSQGQQEEKVNNDSYDILISLSSHVQSTINFLQHKQHDTSSQDMFLILSSRIQFLTSFWNLYKSVKMISNTPFNSNLQDTALLYSEHCHDIVSNLLNDTDNNILSNCFDNVISKQEGKNDLQDDNILYIISTSFINNFLLFCMIQLQLHSTVSYDNKNTNNIHESTIYPLLEKFIQNRYIRTRDEKYNSFEFRYEELEEMDKSVETNQSCYNLIMHYNICKYLIVSSCETKTSNIISSFYCTTIGMLPQGYESVLFSLLSSKQNNIIPNSICSMLQNELKNTNKNQFNQSFQLFHSLFCLDDSMNVDTNAIIPLQSLYLYTPTTITSSNRDETKTTTTSLLPLSNEWLCTILLGTPNTSPDNPANMDNIKQASYIIQDTIQILSELEQQKDNYYIKSINVGSKLYYLFNVCLFPYEELFRYDNFEDLCLSLLQCYRIDFESQDHKGVIAKSLFYSCWYHSTYQKQQKKENLEDVISRTLILENHQLQSFQEFITDISTTFLEYGGQYAFFISVIRFFIDFLLHLISTTYYDHEKNISIYLEKILVTDMLQKLVHETHLLTLSNEADDIMILKESLTKTFSSWKKEDRLSLSIYQCLSKMLKINTNRLIQDNGFMLWTCIGFLARDIIIEYDHNNNDESPIALNNIEDVVCNTTQRYKTLIKSMKDDRICKWMNLIMKELFMLRCQYYQETKEEQDGNFCFIIDASTLVDVIFRVCME